MTGSLKKLFLGIIVASMGAASAHATPTAEEVYRSDRLHTVIYKDGNDPSVFWYLPPVKLYEADGKVVFYKRPGKDDKITYYFYIVPSMTDDLIELLAGEVPGLQNKTQLKPVLARQFGIQVKQFDAASMGDVITDYHYINQPQLIKITLSTANADEFEFFVQNKPGIQANVLFNYESERMDKYLSIELSYKEVYNALNIGVTGQYKFTKAQIEAAISDYVSKKYLTVRSKGDIPIPDIVNKAIEECFTPYKKPASSTSSTAKKNWYDYADLAEVPPASIQAEAGKQWERQASMLDQLEVGWDPTDDSPWGTGDPKGSSGSSGSGKPGSKPGATAEDAGSLEFTFKKEMATSEKTFYYNQTHFVDSSQTASIPVYLSTVQAAATAKYTVTPLVKKNMVVEATNEAGSPLRTGITIAQDEQYIVDAVFAFSATSAYEKQLKWYRWSAGWPKNDDDLYYRVGNSPWNKVNGRAIIKTDSIYHGELQFSLDRKSIWEKIPKDFKDPKMLGFVPAIFTYQKTYPQYNVVISGRKVQVP